MTGNSCLLDTTIVIAYLRGTPTIQQRIGATTPYVSVISIGELYLGAHRAQSPAGELGKISHVLTFATVLVCDVATAELYAQVKHALWQKGRPIPENDIWIAATALQYGLPLVSNDAHFAEVSGLTREQW
jgi:tRNA(fMet)-specific endonuclease VapC